MCRGHRQTRIEFHSQHDTRKTACPTSITLTQVPESRLRPFSAAKQMTFSARGHLEIFKGERDFMIDLTRRPYPRVTAKVSPAQYMGMTRMKVKSPGAMLKENGYEISGWMKMWNFMMKTMFHLPF